MAKKTRRVRGKGTLPRLSEAQLVQPTAPKAERVAVPVVKAAAVEPTPQPAATDFRQEYHYVVNDLQRIGLLAAIVLSALVVLSFLL